MWRDMINVQEDTKVETDTETPQDMFAKVVGQQRGGRQADAFLFRPDRSHTHWLKQMRLRESVIHHQMANMVQERID